MRLLDGLENMTSFKGTKGKWLSHKYVFATIISEDGVLVASCGGRTSNVNPEKLILEQESNALLVSKAPEMLEMLEKVKSILGNVGEFELAKEIEKLIKEATQ